MKCLFRRATDWIPRGKYFLGMEFGAHRFYAPTCCIGEFEGRSFSASTFCPLGSSLPSPIRGVGPGLVWFTGRHGMEIPMEVVAGESAKVESPPI